jgi:hypothetical protein
MARVDRNDLAILIDDLLDRRGPQFANGADMVWPNEYANATLTLGWHEHEIGNYVIDRGAMYDVVEALLERAMERLAVGFAHRLGGGGGEILAQATEYLVSEGTNPRLKHSDDEALLAGLREIVAQDPAAVQRREND